MATRAGLANDSWEALLTAHAILMKRFREERIWDELSMREYDVLYTLAKAGRPVRISELNTNVLLSQPALSRLVDRLIGRGLLARSENPGDRRSVLVTLTEQGSAVQKQVGRRHARSVAAVVSSALSDEEMRNLEGIGRKLAASAREGRSETSTTARAL